MAQNTPLNKSLNKPLAFVFPGQGSQSVGMLDALAVAFPIVEETVAEASSVLGYDLWALIHQGPIEALSDTQKTQPALLASSVAMWRIWCALDLPQPAWLAGHSLGEYSALVCANSISFSDAVRLVAARGRLMQEAVPEGIGAMAAVIGLSFEQVDAVCEKASEGDIISCANDNAIGQTVIAGLKQPVLRAVEIAKEMGAKKVVVLPVSVPSHCALMQSAAEQFQAVIADVDIRAPEIPVLHNVDVLLHTEPNAIREALVKQLTSKVRWVETIQRFEKEKIEHIVECGPGKVLVGLIRRIQRDFKLYSLENPGALDKARGFKLIGQLGQR